MFLLRKYQKIAVENLREAFKRARRLLFVLPTGGGKTVVFSYIATGVAQKNKRVLILGHRREIVDQISRSLAEFHVKHGCIMPSRTMTRDMVQVGMVQTVVRRLHKIPPPDLLVIDEAHHGVVGAWRKVADAFPNAKILGVTATPERMDGKGLREAFDEIIEGPTVGELISDQYLADFEYLAPPSQIDTSGIRTRMGDYAIEDLAAATDRAIVTGDAVQHYAKYLNGRPAIAFCVTVAHAIHVADGFTAQGWRAASVDGSMPSEVRRDRIRALADGRLQVLTSCDLISEGVDVPVVAGAILLRKTKSLALYLQQVGRCLRPKPDGGGAVILDHVGNVHQHGRPDALREWSLSGRRKKDAPKNRTCKLCFRIFGPGQKVECPLDILPSDCPLGPKEPAALDRRPEQVEGELVSVITPVVADWSEGIDLRSARGDDYRRMLRLANSMEKLKQIAQVRGYRPGWVFHISREREGRVT